MPLLLDTDIGDDVDDVFALLLAARQPAVRLLGVTTVYGDVQQRSAIARKLLRLAGRSEVPVVDGRQRTLAGRDPGPVITSGQGFAAAESTDARDSETDAVAYLIEQVVSAAEPPVLVAIGPLTNVGAAIQRDPRFAGRLRSLVIMGGQLGADAAAGEHNFNSDPEATRLVLESGAPLQIGTFEITRTARLGAAAVRQLQVTGDPACQAAAAMLELYCRQTKRGATPMYDPLTLTLAYTSRYLRTRPMALRATYAEQRVQLAVMPGASPNAAVAIAAEAGPFIADMLAVITEGTMARRGNVTGPPP